MQKFLVLYMAPAEGLAAWMKTPESERKEAEEQMEKEWDSWTEAHKSLFTGMTAGAGKNMRVTKGKSEAVSNDVMMFSIIEADSQEAAAKAFEDHPHFGIPDGWIEIMPANALLGMEG